MAKSRFLTSGETLNMEFREKVESCVYGDLQGQTLRFRIVR